eukprot:gene4083-biopygen3408
MHRVNTRQKAANTPWRVAGQVMLRKAFQGPAPMLEAASNRRASARDSAYAFSGGTVRTLEDILEQVAGYRPRYVCVTGGEPLAQPNAIPLLKQLCDAGYEVSLETSGALDISAVDPRVSRVV